MPRSSDSGPGWAPGTSTKVTTGSAEPLGELHDPHRLAIALGVGHPEVAPDVLVGVGALLLADDDDPPAVDPGEPGDDRRVVAEQAVAVQLDEVVGHRVDELERPRPAQVARELDARPDGVARIVIGRQWGQRRWPGHRRWSARRPSRQATDRNESGRKPGVSISRSPGAPGAASARTGSSRSRRDELVAQLGPADDPVDEAVLEQELGALEARRQLLGDRAGRDARAGEADERVRLGDVDVAEGRERGEDAAGRRVGQDRQERHAAALQALERRQRLGQLHERERALLHPRAARGADHDRAGCAPRARARRRG